MDIKEFTEDQIVSFNLGEENFGIGISRIQEIMKVPRITKVPRTPHYFEGIINLRGNIISILNLRKKLKLEDEKFNENTRIIITDIKGQKTGIIVDFVSEVRCIENKKVLPPPKGINIESKYLFGMLKFKDEKKVIMLLDLDEIIQGEDFEKFKDTEAYVVDRSFQEKERITRVDILQLVTFQVGVECYSIDINHVKEVIKLPEITAVPESPDYIEGVFTLRDRVIPVISIATRFGMKKPEFTDETSVIVVEVNELNLGLIVDSVEKVINFPKDDIAPPPPNISEYEAKNLDGLIKIKENGKKRLFLILNLEKIFTQQEQEMLSEMDEEAETVSEEDEILEEKKEEKKIYSDIEQTIAIFNLEKELYGIWIENIIEIIEVPSITPVPRSPDFIEGVINLRGEVITIVDLRKRFGLEDIGKTEMTRIIIVSLGEKKLGMMVDSVSEVVKIDRNNIEALPESITSIDNEFIEGVGKIGEEERMVILFKLSKILTSTEKRKVKRISERKTIKKQFKKEKKEEKTEQKKKETKKETKSKKKQNNNAK